MGHEELESVPLFSFYLVITDVMADAEKWMEELGMDTTIDDSIVHANPGAVRDKEA